MKQCEIKECRNLAKYLMGITLPSGNKEWLDVCDKHDKKIGDENMRRIKKE